MSRRKIKAETRGRKPLADPDSAKSRPLSLRVSNHEYEEFDKRRTAEGVSMATWILKPRRDEIAGEKGK